MNFSSTSTSQFSPLHTFDDQTAEAAAALLQIRGSPRTPNIPFIPDLSRSFTFPSPSSVIGNAACITPTRHDPRYPMLTETTRDSDALLISHSTQSAPTSVPTSVPIIHVPSPRRKRKRSFGPESNQPDSLTDKGKAIEHTSPREECAKTLNVLENDDVVRCICGLQVDDGFTIQCESCQVWQHAACMRIHPKTVPQVYLCEQCNPRLVDGVRARRSLLARLNSQKQAQEKKKQSRRTSSESASKQGKGTASVSPQPQQIQHSPSPNQYNTAFPPDQPYILQIGQQSHNPYPIVPGTTPAKEEVFSPRTPLVPITGSSSTTPWVSPQPLLTPPSKAVLQTLYPRVDKLQLTQCQVCKELKNQCDHAVPPVIALHPVEATTNDDSSWHHYRPFPNAVLRPLVCDNGLKRDDSAVMPKRSRAAQENSKCIEQGGISTIKFGVIALREIKAGEEIVLSCEWEGNVLGECRHANSLGSPTGRSSTNSCILMNPGDGIHYGASNYPNTVDTRQIETEHIPPEFGKKQTNTTTSTRAPKKPKTTKERSRKSGAGPTKGLKCSVNGKRTAAPKQETTELDMDQDVEIDTKSEDLNVNPALESSTNALATLSIRGTPEIPEQRLSHPQSVVDAVLRLSTTHERSSENNLPAVASFKDRRSRASSVSNMLEPAAHSPRVSPIKSIPTPVLSPLLPSSAANANCTAQTTDAATAESNGSDVCLPAVAKGPAITEETKKPPMKRLSLADWKISKDREKQALKEAQEEAAKDKDTVANSSPLNEGSVTHPVEAEVVEAVPKESEANEAMKRGNPGPLNATLPRSPSIDIDVKLTPSVLNGSFNGPGEPTITMGGLSAPERMEARIMKLNVEANDEYNAEARPFTSPQVPCYSLHADSSSDPQHTPPCTRSSDDPAADGRRSPFENTFEEGEIKSSPPLTSVAQPSLHPRTCPPSQVSRPPRSVSPSRSPPTRPRSYHQRQPLRSTSPLSSHGRPALSGPPRHFSSRPVPSAPRALRGAIPPRHPSSSYRPNNYRSGPSRDHDRYRGPSSSQRFHDSSPQSETTRPWRDPPWKR